MTESKFEDELFDTSKDLCETHDELDEVIRFLRDKTQDRVISAKIVSRIKQIPFLQAMRLIHFSPVWSDVKDSHERFEARFMEALESLDDSDNI